MSSTRFVTHRVPILLPVALAFALVAATVVQAVRTAQLHRAAVNAAVRDYATFAVWQYTRRASDYLRLTILNTIHSARAGTTIACRFDSTAVITRNTSGVPDSALASALGVAGVNADRSHLASGMVVLANGRDYLGYTLQLAATPRTCEAAIVQPAELIAVFRHVAEFAPLLPPSFVGKVPNDSLVTIQLFGNSSQPFVTIGVPRVTAGIRAEDQLGPDLADVRVVATLHPVAIERLVAGGLPPSNNGTLVAMLIVTLVLCAVAVQQVRRTNEIARLRSDFVAGVSHELKTPLAQISLFAETLATRDRPFEERLQYARIISRESKRLGQLVDRILHFAGMTGGTGRADAREESDVNAEIADAIHAIEPLAAARGTSVALIDHAPARAPVRAPLDRDAFRQLMLNLLDNGVKFGPDEQHLTVSIATEDGDVVIDVDDQGPGVAAAERDAVFEPFARGAGVSAPGSGIGLAVVRDVVRRHGGSIEVLRAPSGGARFRVRLPGARTATEAAPGAALATGPSR